MPDAEHQHSGHSPSCYCLQGGSRESPLTHRASQAAHAASGDRGQMSSSRHTAVASVAFPLKRPSGPSGPSPRNAPSEEAPSRRPTLRDTPRRASPRWHPGRGDQRRCALFKENEFSFNNFPEEISLAVSAVPPLPLPAQDNADSRPSPKKKG